MINNYFRQDVRERREIILDEETLTPEQIKLTRLVENLARAYEGSKKLIGKPLHQLTNYKP